MNATKLAALYSEMVASKTGRPGYNVLGKRGDHSPYWSVFFDLAREIREKRADPQVFLAAQFERLPALSYPYPRLLTGPGAWKRYQTYVVEHQGPADIQKVGDAGPLAKVAIAFQGSAHTLKVLEARLPGYSRLDLYLAFGHLFSALFMISDPVYGLEAGRRKLHLPLIRKAGKVLADPRFANLLKSLWKRHLNED